MRSLTSQIVCDGVFQIQLRFGHQSHAFIASSKTQEQTPASEEQTPPSEEQMPEQTPPGKNHQKATLYRAFTTSFALVNNSFKMSCPSGRTFNRPKTKAIKATKGNIQR